MQQNILNITRRCNKIIIIILSFCFFQGSLPCDVNSSLSLGSANQFFEEAKRKKAMKEKPDFTGNEVESYETQRLLDHDALAQNYEEVSHELAIVPRYTTRATLQICKYIQMTLLQKCLLFFDIIL